MLPYHLYLLLSYHTMSTSYLISFVIYTLVLILARHLAFVSPLAWGVLTPLDPHVQVLELGACQSLELVDSLSC